MRESNFLGITLVGEGIATGEGRRTSIGKSSIISSGGAVFEDDGECFGDGGGKSLRKNHCLMMNSP